MEKLNESGPDGAGHAGEFETSLMLHIVPELIQMDKITSWKNVATYDWAEADMLRNGRAVVYRTMKEMTTNGTYGAPRTASPEKADESLIWLWISGQNSSAISGNENP